MGTFPPASRPLVPQNLEQPDVAAAQDGVFTRLQARAEGFSDGRQRRLIRSGLWLPVAGRVLRNRAVPIGPWQRAWAVTLNGLVVSHDTAGQIWSLATGEAMHGIGRTRHSDVITAHHLELDDADVVDLGGLRVTTPHRTLIDLLCGQEPRESIPFVTDGLRRRLLTIDDLDAAAEAARGRWGADRARFVAVTCAGRPFSVLEWDAHVLLRGLGAGWAFNVPIHDRDGLIGIVDAVHAASRTIVELDGRAYHGEDRFQHDRTRDQRFAALGYLTIRFTSDDVRRRPRDFVERIRRAVALRSA
ncbi:MAG: endonuclease domain-containing protein [Candidatus Nanopelagicales bacterium]|nr:endonuclease domain-containing protein [Candidatus Nanopelagicales bacterium]